MTQTHDCHWIDSRADNELATVSFNVDTGMVTYHATAMYSHAASPPWPYTFDARGTLRIPQFRYRRVNSEEFVHNLTFRWASWFLPNLAAATESCRRHRRRHLLSRLRIRVHRRMKTERLVDAVCGCLLLRTRACSDVAFTATPLRAATPPTLGGSHSPPLARAKVDTPRAVRSWAVGQLGCSRQEFGSER